MNDLAKQLIKYFKTLGIEVYTNTKARGHQGFFLKNRIDISKNTKEERIIPTLLHEFAHFIHNKLEQDMPKTGGTLEVLFDLKVKEKREKEKETPRYVILNLFQDLTSERFCDSEAESKQSDNCYLCPQDVEKELLLVTHFVDENSLCHKLKTHKEQIKRKIKTLEAQIKEDYPKFMRSKKFKDFDKYIKKSKAKYLLRFDRVKFISPHIFKIMRKVEIFSIDNIEKDFPDMPKAFCAYIRLKSAQKKQARVSKRINLLNKYYSKPTELFARFVECLYMDEARARALAPCAAQRFFELLEDGYYYELKNVLEMLQVTKQLVT